ncbi:MAG: hypothetical protein ACOYLB_02055 [Phototrophicaceae bacterium]
MSKKQSSPSPSVTNSQADQGRWIVPIGIAILVLLGGGIIMWAVGQGTAPAVDIETILQGQWHRIDGDYYIVIHNIEVDGNLQAEYYNPNPINIGEARHTPDTDVFIKLDDTNYPGSTYALNYNQEMQMLEGVYFNASTNQNYQVLFEKIE